MEDDLCDDADGALPRQYEFRFHSPGVQSSTEYVYPAVGRRILFSLSQFSQTVPH